MTPMRAVGRLLEVIRSEGPGAVANKVGWKVYSLGREVEERLRRPRFEAALRRLDEDASSADVLEFIWRAGRRLIEPAQVRSEFAWLLHRVFADRELPRTLMEIGTLNGGTLCAFTRLAAGDAWIVSLDLPGGDFGGGSQAWKAAMFEGFAKRGQRLFVVRADSHEAATLRRVEALLDGRALDFLFIDGDHTYDGVRSDFLMYSPLVREGGLVAFHDILPCSWRPDCEVHRFWSELAPRFASEECVASRSQGWAGIGVIELDHARRAAMAS